MGISKMSKGDLICNGRCDGTGAINPEGSYVSLTYISELSRYRLTISEGAADALACDLIAAVSSKPPCFFKRSVAERL